MDVMSPGTAVVVDDPCILNGCKAVVIQDFGDKAYVVTLFHSNNRAHLVREVVGVRQCGIVDRQVPNPEVTA